MPGSALAYTHSAFLASPAEAFFDLLTHDDHDSFYVVSRRGPDGSWSESAYRKGELSALSFSDGADYYVTRNGFAGRRRKAERVRQVNSLMFDVDCHGPNGVSVLPEATAAILCAVTDGVLPEPSMLIDTGRGVHIYYVLDKATPYRCKGGAINERGLGYLKDVESGLCQVLSGVVSGIPGVEVDTSVFDYTRVSRIPGSFNQNAGRSCQVLSSPATTYALSELSTYRPKPAAPPKPRPRGRIIRFERLLMSRLRKIEELQAHRGFNCMGSRENMCFVYYNTATQIYGPEAALNHTLSFNARFISPLPEADIASIKRTVDSVVVQFGPHKGESGFYPLKAESLMDKLHMDASEAEAVNFFASKRMTDRMAAKEATRAKKQARDNEIVRLYARVGLTQAQIVERLKGTDMGCCLRTVAAVIAAAKVKRAHKVDLKAAAAAALSQASQVCANFWQTSWCVEPLNPFLDSSGILLGAGPGLSLKGSFPPPPLLGFLSTG